MVPGASRGTELSSQAVVLLLKPSGAPLQLVRRIYGTDPDRVTDGCSETEDSWY